MDSLESKIQNLKNTWQGFYANLGLEEVFKKGLDFLTGVINRLNNMPKIFGKIPAAAITIITNAINVIKGLATSFINYVVREVDRIRDALKNSFVKGASDGTDAAKKVVENKTLSSQISAKAKAAGGTAGVIGRIGSIAGTALTTGALAIGDDKAATRGIMTGVGGVLSAAGTIAAGFATGGPYGGIIAILSSIPNLLATITAAIDDIVNAENKRIRSLNEQVDKQKQAVLVAKSETKSYIDQIAKLEELKNKQYESNEAQQDYIDAENNLIDAYPQVIAAFDAKGQAIVDYTKAYSNLYTSIEKTTTAELEYQKLQAQLAEARYKQAQKNVDEKIIEYYTQGADYLPNLFGSQYNGNASNAGNMLSLLYMIFTDSEIGLGKESLADITDDDWVKGLKILSSLNEEGISSLIKKYGTEIIDPTGQGTGIKRFASLSSEWESRDSEDPYEIMDNWMKGLYLGIEESEDFKLFLKELNIDSSLLDEDWQLAASVLAQYMDRAEMARAAEQRAAEITQELTSTRRIAVDYLESISSELGSLNVDLAKELSNENGFFGKWIEYTAKQFNGGKKPTLFDVQTVLGTGDGTGGIIDVYRQMLDAGVYDGFIDFLSAPENISYIGDITKELNKLSEEYGIEFTQEMRQGIYNYYSENIAPLIIDANHRYRDFINGIAGIVPQDDTIFSKNIQNLQEEIKNTSLNLTQSSLELIQTIVGDALKAYRNSDIFSANLYSAYALQVQKALLNSEYEEQIRGILTGIDLGDTQQLQQAISQLEKITDENGTAIFSGLIETLHQIETLAANNLNTLFETALESAKKAYVEIDKIYSSYAKGISFEDLTSTVQLLQNSLKDKFNFDELFTFDKKIGQYVLTAQGLSEVITVKSKEATDALDLAADRYKTAQTLIGKLSFTDDQAFTLEGIDWSSLEIDDEADQALMQKYYQRAYKELIDANEEINADNLITQMLADIETEAEDFNLYRQKIEPLMKRQSAVNNLLANVDLEKILSGGVISDIASTILQTALAEIYENQPDLAKQVLSSIRNFNLGKATNQDFKVLYEQFTELGIENAYDLLTKSVSESLTASTSLINDLLSTSLGSTIILSEEQIRALAAAGYYGEGKDVDEILASGIQSIQVGGEGFTTVLETLLSQAANALRKGQITLDQYNKQVTQVAAFSDKEWGATPIIDAFGKASSLTADAIADIASSLGFTLSEDFDFTELKGITTDYNGHQMVTDMQSFIYSLYTQASDSIKSFDDLEINWNDPRIVEAQSKLNEAFIQQQQTMLEAQTKQLSAIGSVKPGQQFLDLSYVWKELGENARKQLAQAISDAGAHIGEDTGLLELGNASIFNVAEAIKNSGALDQTEEAVAALEDAIISLLKNLTDLLSKGLEGSLSNTEAFDFSKMVSSRYGIEIDFTETEKGLKLSADSAEKLAQELYKAGTFQEKLAFKEYAKSLAGQVGTYKDIYSTMRKLKELETERAEKNGDITEDLKYQLALTREIAYAQMADTDSYNFMDFKMPSDFNGPANYWSSWETFMSKFREAKTNGYMEIEDFYNMVNAVNAVATEDNPITIFGTTLNGSLEKAADLIEQGLGTIGQIDGKGAMITFKDMGDNIFSGMESFGTSVDKGIHEFAQSQIDMIDALIGFVQAMAVMEKMGDLDIDKSGFLSLEELFNNIMLPGGKIVPTIKDSTKTVLEAILANEEYTKALEQFSINGHTGVEVIQGVLENNTEMGQLLVDWYNLAAQMDYDITDIDSIYQSIKDGAIRLGKDTEFDFTIGEGDQQRTISIKQGVAIEYAKDTEGWKWITSDGKSYEAEQAAREHEVELIKQRTIDNWVKEQTIGELEDNNTFTIAGMTINLQVDDDGNITFNNHPSLAEALEEIIADQFPGQELDSVLATKFNARLEGDHLVELTYDQQQAINTQETIQNAAESISKGITAVEAATTATKNLTEALTGKRLTKGIGNEDYLGKNLKKKASGEWGKEKFTDIDDYKKIAAKIAAEVALIGTGEEIGGYTVSNIPENKSTAKPGRGRPEAPFDIGISNEEYALLQVAELTSQLADAQEQTSLYQKLYQQKLTEAAVLDAQIGTLTSQLAIKEDELARVKAEGEAAVEAAQAEGEAAVVAIKAEYESKITALNNTIDTLQETLAQTEANRVLAWQTATDWQKQLADKENENAELLAQLTSLLESAKTDKNIPDDVYETAAKIAEQAYQAEREANANGETSGYIHVPTTPSESVPPSDEALIEITESSVEAQEDSNEKLQAVIKAINDFLAEQRQWQDNSMPDENTTFDQFLSNNRAPFAMPISIPPALLQSFYEALGDGTEEKTELLRTTFGDLNATIEWLTTTTGEAYPRIVLLGEAVKESSKNMDKGRKDIQTASTSIRSSLSSAASSLANGLNTIVRDVSNVADSLNNIKINLPQITGGNNTFDAGLGKGNATGSFGNALAAGTLMGELGPELWVSHGHYYVAGQNGAEFVNLPDDAIVFNHLQTERLLGKGKAGGHGKPVTNERKATSLATGNVHGGLAMASASDTLAQLKQLRAMWEAIAKMSVSDLGKKAGSGGGGGGGGDDQKVFIADLERWFSIEQEILKLEKDITKEQKIRAKLAGDQVAHGKQLYESYRREFDALTAEIDATQTLADLQQKWYEKRRKDLENSAISKIFTFDENGVMKYEQYWDESKGSYSGLDILASLYETDANGVSVFKDAGAQMDYLRSALGSGVNDIFAQLSDGSGNAIKANAKPEEFLQAWDDLVNSYKDELTDLYDQYNENQMKVYDLQNNQNEIIQEIIDNQLSLEQRVLTALIDKAQKAIDDLQDSRDALADANQKYIDGLNDSLQKQKDMYDRNEAANDLNKLQRQLAILQRSGGSASQIRSLQQQINDQMQDAYFTAQQDQISAIQEAADKQIERLDYQIDLMTQTLEYQKENGLLWDQVYEIMTTWNDADILAFIQENTASLQGISSLDLKQQLKEASNEIGIFKADWAEQVGQAVATSISQSRYHEPEKMEQPKDDGKNGTSSGTSAAAASTSKGGGGGSGGGSGSGGNNGGNNSNKNNNTSKNYKLTIKYMCGNQKIKQDEVYIKPENTYINPFDYRRSIDGYIYSDIEPKNGIVLKKDTTITVKYKNKTKTIVNSITSNSGNKSTLSLKDEGFANGGLVDYTGPAQVHGSKSKPESFFDAQSTAILRDDVLGSINVLDSLLADVSTAGTNSLNLGTSESLSIANPVININVDKIANDYDAKRAGQLAFEEMVKIARQSGNRSLSRR